MALVLVGINQNTANIEMREKVAFPPEIVESALAEIYALPPIAEVVIVSTCNRTEIYLDFAEGDSEAPAGDELSQNRQLVDRQAQVVAWLSKFHNIEASELEQCSYSYASEDVVRHLNEGFLWVGFHGVG